MEAKRELYPIKTAYHDDYTSRAHFFILFSASVSLSHADIAAEGLVEYFAGKRDFKSFAAFFLWKDLMMMLQIEGESAIWICK